MVYHSRQDPLFKLDKDASETVLDIAVVCKMQTGKVCTGRHDQVVGRVSEASLPTLNNDELRFCVTVILCRSLKLPNMVEYPGERHTHIILLNNGSDIYLKKY